MASGKYSSRTLEHGAPQGGYESQGSMILREELSSGKEESHARSEAMARVATPIWRWAFLGTVVMWSAWVLLPILTAHASACRIDGSLPSTPKWLLTLYILPIAMCLYFEYRIYLSIFPLETEALSPFKVCGYEIPLFFYGIMVASISFLSHFDLGTNGMFLGRLYKSELCRGDSKVEGYYDDVVASSGTFLASWTPSLFVQASIAWSLMFAQLIWALIHGVPFDTVRGQLEEPVPFLQWLLQSTTPERAFRAQHCMSNGRRVGAWQFLSPLCEASRMMCVQFRSHDHICRTLPHPQGVFPADVIASMAEKALRDAVLATFRLVLESLFFLNLQVNVDGIEKAIDGEQDALTFASVLASLFTVAYGALSTGLKLNTSRKWIYAACAKLGDATDVKEQACFKVKTSIAIYASMALMSFTSVLYISCQLLLSFRCDHGLWTISHGCVEELSHD